MRIYTLGTGDISDADFAKILVKYQIQVVADIRVSDLDHPAHLKREELRRICADNRSEYLYLGNELGSIRGGSIDPALYQRGLSILQGLARTRGLLIVGSTKTPERCVRRKIARDLSADGAEVVHLLGLDQVWVPGPRGPADRGKRRHPRSGRRKGPPRRDGRRPGQRSNQGSRSDRPAYKKKTGRSKMDKIR